MPLPITQALEELGNMMERMNINLEALNANLGKLDPALLADLKTIGHDIAELLRKFFPEK